MRDEKRIPSQHKGSWVRVHPELVLPAPSSPVWPLPHPNCIPGAAPLPACFGKGADGRADRALPLSQPSHAFPHHSVATSPHNASGGGPSVCPGRAEGPAGPSLPRTAHPVAIAEEQVGRKVGRFPCPSCGGSWPALPAQTLHQCLAPVPLELLWRRSRESRKDLKAAGRSEPPQPRWAVQPAGQSQALNADQPLG